MFGTHRLITVLMVALAALSAVAQEVAEGTDVDSNLATHKSQAFCPIIQGAPALEEYTAIHEGKLIRFCCKDCLRAFQADPAKYYASLATVGPFEAAPLTPPSEAEEAESSPAFVWGLLASPWLLLAAVVLGLRRMAGPTVGGNRRAWSRALMGGVGIVIVPVGACYWWFFYRPLRATQVDALHYATFSDYGEPPVPTRPPVEKRLSAKFYRGNDERHERLFNGGHYRTTTFEVSLLASGSERITHGDDLSGRDISVVLEIQRAPNTPDFFFQDEIIDSIFLTKEFDHFLGRSGPVADAVRLTEIDDMQVWEARYPLGKISGNSSERIRGIVYVCESRPMRGIGLSVGETILLGRSPFGSAEEKSFGARFHYALQYELNAVDGVVTPESDLWMGSLYRTRKVDTNTLPTSQWFSHEPIPVLPEKTIYDEELMGIEHAGEDLVQANPYAK